MVLYVRRREAWTQLSGLTRIKPEAKQAQEQVNNYLKRNAARIINFEDLEGPLDLRNFHTNAGYLRRLNDGTTELLVPSPRFQEEVPDFVSVISALRAQGKAKTEGGAKPKLTIKAPHALCGSGRVYCIQVGNDASD